MPDRAFFKLRVTEGQEAEYVRRHTQVWQQVKDDLAAAGVLTMNIWMEGRDIYLMMECRDYSAATAILDASPESVKWEEWMAPMMETGDGEYHGPRFSVLF
jgi:L-rhamnose mutarotase